MSDLLAPPHVDPPCSPPDLSRHQPLHEQGWYARRLGPVRPKNGRAILVRTLGSRLPTHSTLAEVQVPMPLLLGRKKGMTQLFADDGTATGVTVLEAGPCTVTQVRSKEVDGYDALQLGFADVPDRLVKKPRMGHFKKAGVAPKRFLREERLAKPSTSKVGEVLTVAVFTVGDLVDVVGTSKGRGFAGTIKRHGFSRGPETHGCMNVRQPGSLASKRTGKVVRGKRMAGHMGAHRHTTKNLEIMRVDPELNLLFVRGAVPGPPEGMVQVRTARTGVKKKPAAPQKSRK